MFRIIDDNNSSTLDFLEFKKGMKDYKTGFDDNEIEELFKVFDINKDRQINYDEFLRTIRGKLNDTRRSWVKRAFKLLDVNDDGVLTVSDIEKKYNARMHPEVKSGKRTEKEVLKEFLETFETHHNILMGKVNDGVVTPEEFEEYYANVSASIDTDEYFGLMMKNAWKLDEAAETYKKGWKAEEEDKIKDPSATPPKILGRSPRRQVENNISSKDNMLKYKARDSRDPSGRRSSALEHFRQALLSRGAKGILGMARQFKIMDYDESGELDLNKFIKAVKDFKAPIDEQDIRIVFDIFDRNNNGRIHYDEFVRSLKGKMNSFRIGLVDLAFRKLDKNGSGRVDIYDLKGVYSAKDHPDVRSGKKTEDQALSEIGRAHV